ncbi:hypothetical protein CRE_24822 [Caenorhabditis remanei]|uniref:Uncharacterized protein n=1 Tax=Caenorhabditis remanei TaxID=31234 RepID=E3NHP3_CAERE|nr:hypothetical protein CRE_24822 [Caenorhabditis remanei]
MRLKLDTPSILKEANKHGSKQQHMEENGLSESAQTIAEQCDEILELKNKLAKCFKASADAEVREPASSETR